jgi:hypothetical protein
VNSRLEALTARRKALQARCDLLRGDAELLYGGIEDRTVRVDRTIETVRSLTPLIAIGGFVLLLAMGPQRALHLARRGLTVALYANQARRSFFT